MLPGGDPGECNHAGMVEAVEEGELPPLGPRYDEEGVHVVEPLAHVEQPARVRLPLVRVRILLYLYLHRLTHDSYNESNHFRNTEPQLYSANKNQKRQNIFIMKKPANKGFELCIKQKHTSQLLSAREIKINNRHILTDHLKKCQ